MPCCPAVLLFCFFMSQAVFPEGTPGTAIDTLARLPLWRDGLNYRHGTGEQRLRTAQPIASLFPQFSVLIPLGRELGVRRTG
jgi:hypothetical protein